MMDSLRAWGDDADVGEAEEEPRMDTPPEIGFDERRMHVRAYNYWVSLLNGRAYPSIEDLEPESLGDFGPNSVLLDFTAGSDNPSIAYLGRAVREQCELGSDINAVAQVPSRSLLSRLTDHYLQIIANCAPIGFEAEFVSHKGLNTMYRGILMPLSSDGDTIDFIYGVINWKELCDSATSATLSQQVDRALSSTPAVAASPVWADGPNAMPEEVPQPAAPAMGEADETLELGVQYQIDDEAWLPTPSLDAEAGLADRLSAARESADAVKSADMRSRSALYRALSEAYDFACAAEDDPEGYAELLEDAGLKAQERAPMTPVVKLVFGADYDKGRLTEFAAALSYGRRQGLGSGSLFAFLESFEGGLKGIVQAERRERRPRSRPDAGDVARATLRQKPAIAHVALDAGDAEFVLLVARREADGMLAVLAPVDADDVMLERALRKSV